MYWLTVLREGLLSPLEEIPKAVRLSHIPITQQSGSTNESLVIFKEGIIRLAALSEEDNSPIRDAELDNPDSRTPNFFRD
ncbi:hypothetical protein BGY98DRAFT_1100117 [Russula aff. rugulosa BPL654]|nr:hypothetical protein BGY98DRAFT_1100117 [Russula aff. rugulosa BPL654]